MEIDLKDIVVNSLNHVFEDVVVNSLNHINDCLNNVIGYNTQINFERVIEAKTIVTQILQLIYLKNAKLNKSEDGSHGIDPNVLTKDPNS